MFAASTFAKADHATRDNRSGQLLDGQNAPRRHARKKGW
jgi:hypothetical protein